VQTDVKKLVAYSSVAHLGFCILGLIALNNVGSAGSVLYMINHGLSTGALFLLIGMVYERYHTRSMKRAGRPGGQDARLGDVHGLLRHGLRRPARASTASSSEFMCLLGAFQADSRWGTRLGQTPAGEACPARPAAKLGPGTPSSRAPA
jgi:NADH-quinone oxidoreductase subunit M